MICLTQLRVSINVFLDRMYMYSKEVCKKNKQEYTDLVFSILDKITSNKKLQCALVLIFHYSIALFVTYQILVGKNIYYLLIAIVIGIHAILTNITCNGCYFIHAERKFCGEKWIGPWSILKILGLKHDGKTIKNYFFIFCSIVIFLGIYNRI